MTAVTTGDPMVSGRMQPRYTGPAAEHEVRWRGTHVGEAYYPGGMVGDCDCGKAVRVGAGYTGETLTRAARQHAGIPDP